MRGYMNINWYRRKIIDLLEISPLEGQFQNFLVYPILDSILTNSDLDLVDCHNFRQYNTMAHDRRGYSVLVKAVPDLLIATNFFYHNRDNKIYEALQPWVSVEVKRPNNDWMLDKTHINYEEKLYLELLPNLWKCGKMILTNLRTWSFFDAPDKRDENIATYMDILELCGIDCIEQKNQQFPNNRVSELQNMINEKMDTSLKEAIKDLCQKQDVTRKDFLSVVETADQVYLEKIKDFIIKCHVKTIKVIQNQGKLVVNRHFARDGSKPSAEEITEVTDLGINSNNYDELFGYLNEFCKPR